MKKYWNDSKSNRVAGIFSDSLQEDVDAFLDKVIKTLGLGLDNYIESIEWEKIVNFKPGRVILAGAWAYENSVFYCAARKTLEGEEIWNKYWARPNLDVPSFNNLKYR